MRRFLVVRTGSLGDIVHGLPVAAALKKAYPAVQLDWVVEERYAELLACVPAVDGVVPVRLRDGVKGLADPSVRAGWRNALRRLRRARYDATLDLQGLIRSGIIAASTGAPLRVGFPGSHARERPSCLFANVRPRCMPSAGHVIDRNLCLLHPLGIRAQGARDVRYRIPEAAEKLVEGLLPARRPDPGPVRVAVHPFAGWPTKEWRADRYAEVLRRLAGLAWAEVHLVWGPGERERAQALEAASGGVCRVPPLLGPAALLAFLARCDVFLGADSGPMQMASSLGVRVVALFGRTDPGRNGPARAAPRVAPGRPRCAPCYRRRCPRTECMDAVGVEGVWEALRRCMMEARGETGTGAAG